MRPSGVRTVMPSTVEASSASRSSRASGVLPRATSAIDCGESSLIPPEELPVGGYPRPRALSPAARAESRAGGRPARVRAARLLVADPRPHAAVGLRAGAGLAVLLRRLVRGVAAAGRAPRGARRRGCTRRAPPHRRRGVPPRGAHVPLGELPLPARPGAVRRGARRDGTRVAEGGADGDPPMELVEVELDGV